MIYSFGEYQLDTRLCELRRAAKATRVEPQVFDVLAYLVEHRDRVVTKQELLEKIWADRFVTEATLSSRLMAARKAVGDSGRAQRVIQTVHGRGFRFIAEVEEYEALSAAPIATSRANRQRTDQAPQSHRRAGSASRSLPVSGGSGTALADKPSQLDIRFATAPNGGRIAYAVIGEGPPLVLVPGWISHLEQGWLDASRRAFYQKLARRNTVVLYDKHGTGLSDRTREDFTLEAELRDLEAVVSHLGLEGMSLLGASQGGAVAAAYAVDNPGFVSRVILYGSYADGSAICDSELKESMLSLIQAHWGIGSKVIADIFIPGADAATAQDFARLQREAATADMARRLLKLVYEIDVSELLAGLQTPTLVVHRKRDRAIPFRLGRHLAKLVPKARFAPLEGNIHFPWLGDADSVLRVIGDWLEEPLPQSPKAPARAAVPNRGADPVEETLGGSLDGDDGWQDRSESSSTHAAVRASGTFPLVRAVGRDKELRHLQALFDKALAGSRQVVCVSGEPGLGKTTLVETFLERAGARTAHRVGSGQCIEHRGAGEAYMPVLEALGRMCREAAGEELIALLETHAPTWLVQMPWLVGRARLDDLQRRVLGATQDRMLREIVESLDALTARQPLLLVLEDLHWSDYSTIDLLESVARRREPARLMVIATYRPADAKTAGHPLHGVMQELCARGLSEEIALRFLSEQAVGDYLAQRFTGVTLPAGLPGLLRQRTEGNPFFMVTVADQWVSRGLLREPASGSQPSAGLNEFAMGVPESLRQMIEQQFERLSEVDQRVLEAAAVAGLEFSTATIAAADDLDEEDSESRCSALAREGRFLRPLGVAEWPDGTLAARFGFIHSLHQEVLYERVATRRRARLHRRIGQRIEAGYKDEARDMATELATHFVRGRDAERAIPHLLVAAQQALERSAHRQAIEHLNTGLQMLDHLPDSAQRIPYEFSLRATLGPALIATEGWLSSEAERNYQQALELGDESSVSAGAVLVRYGLATMYEVRGQFKRAQTMLEGGFLPPRSAEEGKLLLESHELMACSMFHQGLFKSALENADLGLDSYDPQQQYSIFASMGGDPGVSCHEWATHALWFLGHPDQALKRTEVALEVASDHFYSLAAARVLRACVHQYRQEEQAVSEWARAAIDLASEQGFPYRRAVGRVFHGWALARQGQLREGLEQLRLGLEACRTIGVEMDRPYYLGLLAEACSLAGCAEEGLYALSEALATVRGSRAFFYEAELHRLMGDLVLKAGSWHVHEVEASFRTALETARRQNAKSLELRAAMSLAQLWHRQDRTQEAHELLAPVYDWFTEGFDTPDLRRAKELLESFNNA